MNERRDVLDSRPAVLRDGTQVVTRPIGPADGVSLMRGLERLSPEGNAYRFLHYRKRFTERELYYLTHCDFVNHIGLVLVITDDRGNEVDAVGVARSIRSSLEFDLAEVAIVFVDEWQRRGAGTILLRHLADLSWQAGIRRWQAFILDGNVAARRLLERVAEEVRTPYSGSRMNGTVYALRPPDG